ncbi:hypothetical protein [Variovorax sp. UMC13]|uniref:hypothetical protein n=1 Tax=Variovorax sp. UMC13 TaxID=1862326 RepID=UPI0016036575|nr:hypothetical protein [Variovorax sp. UMC13]MBB1599504.1 hypothetical protein [Variovorax sp. UMC13]
MISIGIDPGMTGAVAFIDTATGKASVFDLPISPVERRICGLQLARLLREHAPVSIGGRVYLEELHARAGGGGMQQMGSMMKTVGIILGSIDCTRLPVTQVTPQRWKKFFGLIDKPSLGVVKKTDAQRKAASLTKARELFPALQGDLKRAKDDGRAEALLIAQWGWRNAK